MLLASLRSNSSLLRISSADTASAFCRASAHCSPSDFASENSVSVNALPLMGFATASTPLSCPRNISGTTIKLLIFSDSSSCFIMRGSLRASLIRTLLPEAATSPRIPSLGSIVSAMRASSMYFALNSPFLRLPIFLVCGGNRPSHAFATSFPSAVFS